MSRLRTAAILIALAGCAPHVIWRGRDPARQVRAELVAEGSTQRLRVGEVEGERFDAVGTDGIVFAPGGTALAYPAVRGGQWFMITGGKSLGPYRGVAEPRFSPDGARLAFIAHQAGGFHAVVDGQPGRAFEHIQPGTLQFSRNSAHVGYVGSSGNCAQIVVDGAEGVCLARVLSLRITEEGKPAALVREQRQDRLLLDTLGPPYDEITEWALSESGRLGYAARTGARGALVLDGALAADCQRVRHLRFGDRGRRAAWVCAEQGRASVVIDGVAGRSFPTVSAPVLAAQAPQFAYLARDERGAWVVAGESTLGPYAEAVDLVVARTGGGFAFVARAGGITRVIHGGRQTPVEVIVGGSLVVSDDGAHWAAITGAPATQALWITIDGAHRRQLVSSEVFGDPTAPLGPWLERELREAAR